MTSHTSTASPTLILLRARPEDDPARTGFLLVTASAIAFSTAGLFTRVITCDVWTMLFYRGLFGGLLIAGYVAWQHRTATPKAFASIGWAGLSAATCSTVATICFINALRQTTVADVTVIYATAPFLAALIAWIWTRERQTRTTLVASALALAGVVVMFGAALSMGQALGDLLALVMTLLMASMMVIIRQNQQVSMLPAACLSTFACALVVAPLAHPGNVTMSDFTLLALFGTTQFGLGLLLLTIGSRLISATRASLLTNLELPFAPLWVWLAFGEMPSNLTYIGGGIVVAAVLLDLAAPKRSSHFKLNPGFPATDPPELFPQPSRQQTATATSARSHRGAGAN
jgi:drug/metabolite transporter (DMT)-like permease